MDVSFFTLVVNSIERRYQPYLVQRAYGKAPRRMPSCAAFFFATISIQGEDNRTRGECRAVWIGSRAYFEVCAPLGRCRLYVQFRV
jgi:hypothetical protein